MIHGNRQIGRDCDGCGDPLEVSATYAGDDGFDPLEIIVWRCGGCAQLVETTEPLLGLVDEARRRVA